MWDMIGHSHGQGDVLPQRAGVRLVMSASRCFCQVLLLILLLLVTAATVNESQKSLTS